MSADMSVLPNGKLPIDLLGKILGRLPTTHPRLVVGPRVGEDAAVIDMPPGLLLVVKSDPVTFATDEIGFYAVNVCSNDLAVTGAEPLFYLPTVLLPAGETDEAVAERIFQQLDRACRALGVTVAGGHTEITPAVRQPVVAGTMLGTVGSDSLVRTDGCRPGDVILLAGVVPVEGVSIIAREKRPTLLERGWSAAELETAAAFLYRPGISVLAPARVAARAGLVTAMHDPTEGGVATGLLELALAADVGLEVNLDTIQVPVLSQRLCGEFGLDPLGTIASGALLATARPEHAPALLDAWQQIGWPAVSIGQVLEKAAGVFALRCGRRQELPRFPADEITKLWR